MARAIKEVGTKQELEVFDVGLIGIAKHPIRQGPVLKTSKPVYLPFWQKALNEPSGYFGSASDAVE